MSIAAASSFTLLFVLPALVLLVILYGAIWGIDRFFEGVSRFLDWKSIIPVLLLGVPAHEAIHGLTWLWLGRIPKEDIKFGIRSLTPYTHCEVPMPASIYRAGAIMPGLILGLIPYSIGLVTGSSWHISFGLVYIFAAGGDILILWILRGVKAETRVEDHPSRVGCYVYE